MPPAVPPSFASQAHAAMNDRPAAQPEASVEPQAPVTAKRASAPREFLAARLHSLDAYRGLIMVSLAFGGFGLAATADKHLAEAPDSSFWQQVRFQFEHVEWAGGGFWDMIQPSFMFMVGVSMAYSYSRRRERGQSYPAMLGHAAWRSVVLVLLGVFLISNWSKSTNWSLVNVLTQIGLGYTFLFLLWDRPRWVQGTAAAAILLGTWLLYVLWPGTGIPLESGNEAVGVSAAWAQEHLAGISPAWHKNANAGHAIDLWLLNLLPQEEPFAFNRGGYQTINFLPSLATMIFGLMCGELLRNRTTPRQKLAILTAAGVAGIVLALLLHAAGICPIVKRIWTPAWTLYSTGICCLILAGLYAVVDVLRFKAWTWPLMIVGVNSIAIYCMGQLLKPWTARTLQTHLGPDIFNLAGPLWEPAVKACLIGLCFWLACWWMYRQKIFIRI